MFYTFRNQNGLAVVLTKIGYGFWGALKDMSWGWVKQKTSLFIFIK